MTDLSPAPSELESKNTDLRLDRAVLRLWRIKGLAAVGLVTVAAAFLEIGLAIRADATLFVPGVPSLLIALVGSTAVVRITKTAWARWRVSIGDDALGLQHGFVLHHSSLVPWYRVQQLNVESGPLSRALGLAELVVHTASAATDAHIPGLRPETAEELRRVILERSGARDGV